MKVQCPAKVNLFLEVTGRRPDGYHRIATLFAKINLYDVLDLAPAGGRRPRLEVVDELGGPPLAAGPDNLVWRAADAFYKAFRVGVGVRIVLTKRIPMGAGLGGGSSDAAGTLLGLAKLLGVTLDAGRRRRLHEMAAALGADVPFFLTRAGFCVATGIGDRLRPVAVAGPLPYMVVAWPGFGVPTGPVYGALPPREKAETLTRLSQLDRLIRGLKRGRPVEEWGGLLFNRLEQARLPALAEVAQARRILEAAGARGTRMSGSGSSVFGFVASHVEGETVVRRLQVYPWKVYLTSCQG